jgi:hypothetical protein
MLLRMSSRLRVMLRGRGGSGLTLGGCARGGPAGAACAAGACLVSP